MVITIKTAKIDGVKKPVSFWAQDDTRCSACVYCDGGKLENHGCLGFQITKMSGDTLTCIKNDVDDLKRVARNWLNKQ